MKKLFIIILDYRNLKALEKCLESVEVAIEPAGWSKEVLVINNNQINRGFAKAANSGIKKALNNRAEAVLLLNQDTVVKKDFLISLLANPADIVEPVIKFKRNGHWIYDFGGKIDWRIGRTRHIEKFTIYNLQFTKIDYVSGCAMMIRRPVLEKIGLLNERYFLYFEDVDFCLRAKKAGFKIAVEPKSIIEHHLEENRSFFKKYHLLKSNLIFISDRVPLFYKPIAYLYWLILAIKMLIR